MSRAFVMEDGPDNAPLPDLPVSPLANHVTRTWLKSLQSRLAETQARLQALRARPDRLDRLPEAAAERDIRSIEARLRTAILIDPAGHPLSEMAFGLRVTVADETGARTGCDITGADEADASHHRIAPQSPLGRALLGGARVGEVVTWRKPGGPVAPEIIRITHADPPT